MKYVNQSHVMPTRFVVNDFDFTQAKDEYPVSNTADKPKAKK